MKIRKSLRGHVVRPSPAQDEGLGSVIISKYLAGRFHQLSSAMNFQSLLSRLQAKCPENIHSSRGQNPPASGNTFPIMSCYRVSADPFVSGLSQICSPPLLIKQTTARVALAQY
ncbi:disabled-like protein 1 [Platysternon megacephalum]|uniref:Disabled-like protein 1 n=1 Tax=Platysternon megacephalum TaxID=55544 RepID=A0A4D9EKI3_9SAUR|nr:disabled-like protein 1 [Platysternon megacephalum]